MSVIQGEDLSKAYGKLKAIDHLSFEIEENKITGLIGRNGSGKTTLLKMIAGYLKPTSGELKVFSEKPFNSLDVSANSIFVDDTMTFPDAFTLVDILTEVAPFYANWNSSLAIGLFDYFSFNPKQPHSNLSKGSKSTFNSILGIASRSPLTTGHRGMIGTDTNPDGFGLTRVDNIGNYRGSTYLGQHELTFCRSNRRTNLCGELVAQVVKLVKVTGCGVGAEDSLIFSSFLSGTEFAGCYCFTISNCFLSSFDFVQYE